MEQLLLVIPTIACVILIIALRRKDKKYNAACKEISNGWRNIVMYEEIPMKEIFTSGIDRHSIASTLGYRIIYLIKSGASFKAVYKLIDATGCNKDLGSLDDSGSFENQIACKTQAVVKNGLTAAQIQEWIYVVCLTDKEKKVFQNSFLSKIQPSGFVMDLKLSASHN